jgi:hypothetical protein
VKYCHLSPEPLAANTKPVGCMDILEKGGRFVAHNALKLAKTAENFYKYEDMDVTCIITGEYLVMICVMLC